MTQSKHNRRLVRDTAQTLGCSVRRARKILRTVARTFVSICLVSEYHLRNKKERQFDIPHKKVRR